MKFLQQWKVNPIDFILKLIENFEKSDDDLGKLFNEFKESLYKNGIIQERNYI